MLEGGQMSSGGKQEARKMMIKERKGKKESKAKQSKVNGGRRRWAGLGTGPKAAAVGDVCIGQQQFTV